MTLLVNSSTTINTNQKPASGPAISYDADNITVVIDPGIDVVSKDAEAISSSRLSSALVNKGNVLSKFSAGVSFSGNDGSIVNEAGGSISGKTLGVSFSSDGAELTNSGAISATGNGIVSAGVKFESASNDFVLNNDGDIWGENLGVYIISRNDGGVINNSGSIWSLKALFINLQSPGLKTEINNKAGGLIKGDALAIETQPNSAIALDNRGKVVGDIYGGDQGDLVANRSKIKGDLHLRGGNDEFDGVGSSTAGHVFGEEGKDKLFGSNADDTLDGGPGSDLLRGGKGEDKLLGGNADDTLEGGAHSDLLRGGKGKDKQFGGANNDTFDFNDIKDSVKGSKRDQLKDFDRSDDIIDVSGIDAKTGSGNQTFNWIGRSDFHDRKGELRYEDKGSTVIVQGDVDGDGKADFEIFVNVGKLGSGDFVL